MFKKVSDVVALGGAIVGATLVAANIGMAALGYFCFLLSAIASIYLLKTSRGPSSLLILNVFFAGINIFGLIRHI